MEETTNMMLARLLMVEPTLASELESTWLKPGQVINSVGSDRDYVYFPEGCILARTARDARGKWNDVWLIGREGLSGVMTLLADVRNPFRFQVRAPGYAWRAPSDAIVTLLRKSSASRDVLQRYANFVLVQAAQTGFCNRAHSLEERILRYLLFMHWSSGSRDLPLTHALLADSLGAHRPGVTRRLQSLHNSGGVLLGRATLSIRDRAALERSACPCCQGMLAHYDRLFEHSRERTPSQQAATCLVVGRKERTELVPWKTKPVAFSRTDSRQESSHEHCQQPKIGGNDES